MKTKNHATPDKLELQAEIQKTRLELAADLQRYRLGTYAEIERNRSNLILWIAGMLLAQAGLMATLTRLL